MRLLGLLLLVAAAAQAASGRVKGDWGGAHVRLSVGKDSGEVEFDCGHGSVEAPLALDKDGGFSRPGRYVAERGGPTPKDAVASGRPARYEGSIRGEQMTLKVILDDGTVVGPFELTRGAQARLMKCR